MAGYLQPFADAIAHLPTTEIARRAKATGRTVENWRQARSGPSWRHVVSMLNDDVMRPLLLKAVKRIERPSAPHRMATRGGK